MNPYIGITDFTKFEEVANMLRVFNAHLPAGSNRKLHVGVMISHKTLNDIPSRYKWENVFPPKEEIANIFASQEAYNCVHFADYELHKEPFATWEDLIKVLSLAGENVHALQLDMTWPAPWQISQAVRNSGKNIEVILQVGKKAIEQVGDDPQTIVEMLDSYQGVIHRVLLDKSMGRGVSMNAQEFFPLVEAIKESYPTLGIVVAGGLGPTSIDLVRPITEMFPDVSIDAQSKLRPSGSALDPVDWDMAAEYLTKALKLFP